MVDTIRIKRSVTTDDAPVSLALGELAVNVRDARLFVGDDRGAAIELRPASDEFFLNANATTTTVTNARCRSSSTVLIQAYTPHAANDTPYLSIVPGSGQFVVTHANNARVDRRFRYAIIG